MSIILPSGKSAVPHKMPQTSDLSQCLMSLLLASVRLLSSRNIVCVLKFTTPSALLPHPYDEAGVCRPHTQGVFHISMEGARYMLSFCRGTIANLSSREHRVAICTATNSPRHLRVRTLYPFLDRAYSEFP